MPSWKEIQARQEARNKWSQDLLRSAENHLAETLSGQDPEENPRMQLLLAAIRAMRCYSHSLNGQ